MPKTLDQLFATINDGTDDRRSMMSGLSGVRRGLSGHTVAHFVP